MSKRLFVLFLVFSTVFVFSCKSNIESSVVFFDVASEGNAELSAIEPSEAYLETRTLRDELVEDVIFGQYRADDYYIDRAIVALVLGDDADLNTDVYRRDQKVLLTYTLPSYKTDAAFQEVELDEEYTEDIIVKSFDFCVDGRSGFIVVSNDDRLGTVLSYSLDEDINKTEIKNAAIEKANAKIADIKREWSNITTSDVYSVIERGWGRFYKDQITRGKVGDAFCTHKTGDIYTKGSTISASMKDFFNLYCFERFILNDEDEWSMQIHKFISTLCHSIAVASKKNLLKTSPKDKAEAKDYILGLFSNINEKELKSLASKIKESSSVSAEYAPYKGYLIRDSKSPNLYLSINPLLCTEKPVIKYSFYNDAVGEKYTIENVQRYIKNLKYYQDPSPLTLRIIEHLTFALRGGAQEKYVNNFRFDEDVFKSASVQDFRDFTSKVSPNKNKAEGWSILSEVVKERYGVDISKFNTTDGNNPYDYNPYAFSGSGKLSNISPFLFEVGGYYVDTLIVDMGEDKKRFENCHLLAKGLVCNSKYTFFPDECNGDKFISRVTYTETETKRKALGIFKTSSKYSYEGRIYVSDGLSDSESYLSIGSKNILLHTIKPRLRAGSAYVDEGKLYTEGLKDEFCDEFLGTINMPFPAKDGRVLIDVVNTKDNRYDLRYEDEVFNPSRTKYAKNDISGSQSDSNITVTKAKKNDNDGNLTLIPDPYSTDSIGKQLKDSNPGKQSITSNGSGGQRISLSKDGTVSKNDAGNSAGATATSTGTGIGLKKGALCKKPRLKI